MSLPPLSVTQRHALKKLQLEASQVLPQGKAWLCAGRTIVTKTNLDSVHIMAATAPSKVDTLCVSAGDYPAVREWIG